MALAPEEVGKRIAEARKGRGWTHEEFRDAVSEKTGRRVNLRTVQRWQKGRDPKTGKSWLPRLGTLMDLADLLEVPRSYFVEEATVSTRDEEVDARLDRIEQLLEALVARSDPDARADQADERSGRRSA